MPITTVSNLILLTGACFGRCSSSSSTATRSFGTLLLQGSSQPVCIFHDPSLSACRTYSCQDINIPIFAGLYFGFKIIKRTKIWKPTEMDFVTVSLNWLMAIPPDWRSLLSFTGHPYSGRNRIATDSTEAHRGAHCRYSFLSAITICYLSNLFYLPNYINKCITLHVFWVDIYMAKFQADKSSLSRTLSWKCHNLVKRDRNAGKFAAPYLALYNVMTAWQSTACH